MAIRLFSKLPFILKLALFCIFYVKFFNPIYKYTVKTSEKIWSRIATVSNQCKFQKRPIIFHFFKFCVLLTIVSANLPIAAVAEEKTNPQYHYGQLLFLVQQGEIERALKLYQLITEETGEQNIEILQQLAVGILEYGFKQSDPECQLLALFGSIVSAHRDVYPILEEGLNNKHPEIQIVALEGLAQFQDHRADQSLIRAIGSPTMLIRYEAAKKLCKKKHPQAVSQTESLMYKTPQSLWVVYPSLFALVGDAKAKLVLKKLLNHPSPSVRCETIIQIRHCQLEDLLPQVRSMLIQSHYAQQEACIFTLGQWGDESIIPKLKILTSSQFPNVALAAHYTLYQMGIESEVLPIEKLALQGNIQAITLLGKLHKNSAVLLELAKHKDLQVRFNATVALLNQNQIAGLDSIEEWVLQDKKNLGFTSQKSPGKFISYWKVTSSASQLLSQDTQAYLEHLELQEWLLEKTRLLSEEKFLILSRKILDNKQNELVPFIVEMLADLQTPGAIECLKKHQQQLGAPFVRTYCALALYRLEEEGPYSNLLKDWITKQNEAQLIRFEPFTPWKIGEKSYGLTPEESSKLLIAICEIFASRQEKEGIDILVNTMIHGHSKNRYALAGLLLRATQ